MYKMINVTIMKEQVIPMLFLISLLMFNFDPD